MSHNSELPPEYTPLQETYRPYIGGLIRDEYRGVRVQIMQPDPELDIVAMSISPAEQAQINQDRIAANEQNFVESGFAKYHTPGVKKEPPSIEKNQIQEAMSAKKELAEATERGDIHKVSMLSPETLITMTRAIDLYGTAVAHKFDVREEKVNFARHQIRAVSNQQALTSDPVSEKLSHMTRKEAEEYETEINNQRMQWQHEHGEDSTVGAESVVSVWKDLKDEESSTFRSEYIDSSAYMIAALALAHMKEVAIDNVEQKAAGYALADVQSLPEDTTEVEIITQPEHLRRVKLARVLGPWAGDMAATAVVKHHLAAVA